MQTQIMKQDQLVYNNFFTELLTVEGSYWTDYYKRTTSHIIKLSNGQYILFEKPRIKTSFCFGYGDYLRATEEAENRANDMANYASTNSDYFMNENLKELNKKIELVENNDELYTVSSIPKEQQLLYTNYITKERMMRDYRDNNNLLCIKLTDEDRTLLLQTLYSEKIKFEKRLNTYLKKYGLSKLNVWTYLRD